MVFEIKQGSMTVDEYEDFFLGLEIMNQKNEQDLIKIAREGLKEDIREGLESEEFATLPALFLEAAAVEEILEMENFLEEKPRRRKKRKNILLDPEDELPWDKPQPEEEEESDDEESDDDWSYEGDTRVEVEYDDMGFSTPDSVSAASGTVTDESESLTATNSTADGDSLADSSVSFANIVAENSAAGGGSVADSSVSIADSVADNSAAGLGSISGSNSTGVGSVSGNVADSSPSAAGSSRISNSIAFPGASKCSATSAECTAISRNIRCTQYKIVHHSYILSFALYQLIAWEIELDECENRNSHCRFMFKLGN
ncbi:hypothetical protein YC2023_050327 [Brassica napus]